MPLPASLANTLELPVVGSPLFIVSGPELVIAQCKAGIVGSFPALNARPVEKLDEWLIRIENELGECKALNPTKKVAPYAVNQICHASNDRLMKDMETCVKHQVPIIITSLRPPKEIVEAAHSYGGVVFHDVINVKHARKAAEHGVDGLIQRLDLALDLLVGDVLLVGLVDHVDDDLERDPLAPHALARSPRR